MHGWLSKNMHFAWSEALVRIVNDLLKLNNGINAFLINSKINLYHTFLVNIYVYW